MTAVAHGGDSVLIGAYGMFWDADAVDWWCQQQPQPWLLLGRSGVNRPGLRLVDFRRARGVYVLFDHHGAYYAGLARGSHGLGGGLKDHMEDKHRGRWQRFCWFASTVSPRLPIGRVSTRSIAERLLFPTTVRW